MAGVELVDVRASTSGYPAPTCDGSSDITASIARAATVDQWLVTARLPTGATLEWSGAHGDEALYLLDGLLDVDGRPCVAGGAVIVESGAPARVTAQRGSRIVHVGAGSPDPPADGPFGPPAADGHAVHVVGPDGIGGVHDYQGGATHAAWFTDGQCPRCRIMFFRVWGIPGSDGPSHSHSQDELIHVIEGALHIGPTVVGPGSTVAIPAHRRYGFRTRAPWAFLNHRRDMSFMTADPRQPAVMETG